MGKTTQSPGYIAAVSLVILQYKQNYSYIWNNLRGGDPFDGIQLQLKSRVSPLCK